MRITADISLYPLEADFVAEIRAFILRLREEPGIEVVTNQVSTQVRGDFDAVTGAINRCLRASLDRDATTVAVVKYLGADLPIASPPRVERER